MRMNVLTVVAALLSVGCGGSDYAIVYEQPTTLVGDTVEVTDGRHDDVTLASLLDEMVDYGANVEFPSPRYTAAQRSSYDRAAQWPGTAGWFADDDGYGFVRLEYNGGRREKVLFDERGPGAVTRIWLTTSDKRGTLRFYFDDETTARVTIAAYDMSRLPVAAGEALVMNHTHYSSDIAQTGGNTCYLPMPYAQHLKITLEEDNPDARIPHYYHIGFRTYERGTAVRSFTLDEMRDCAALLQKVNAALLEPVARGREKTHDFDIGAGETAVIEGQGRAITSIALSMKDVNTVQYRRIVNATRIEIVFDGQRCVDVPLALFFGGGENGPKTRAWYLDSSGRGLFNCRWLMPFRERAEIRLVASDDISFAATMSVGTASYVHTPNTLYFHATSREEKGIKVSNEYGSLNPIDWNVTTIEGRGIMVGDVLAVDNKLPDWFGEGDEKIYIDDERFPSFFGTGLEDYYNCSWAPVVTFLTPFGGVPRADSNTSHGKSTWLRLRNTDAIPFEKKLRFDFEMEGWSNGTVDYTTAVFWYGDLTTHVSE